MAHAEPVTGTLQIELVYCAAPGDCDLVALTLPAGTQLATALQASGLLARHGLVVDGLQLGVWGRARPPDHVLRDRDRVEIYRPLTVDPKDARRQRYRQHRNLAQPKGRPKIKPGPA